MAIDAMENLLSQVELRFVRCLCHDGRDRGTAAGAIVTIGAADDAGDARCRAMRKA
jgi:hypothetical protein